MYLLLLRFASLQVLFHTPFFKYVWVSALLAVFVKGMFAFIEEHLILRRAVVILAGAFLGYYFGIVETFALLTIFLGSNLFGKLVTRETGNTIQTTVGFFALLFLFIFFTIVLSPKLALWLVLTFCTVLILLFSNRFSIKKHPMEILDKVFCFLSSFSYMETWILILIVLFGSLPQSSFQWDSVYANLYIAKWYVHLNSTQPLEEAISSFFPQHAILYYSLFYAVGGFRALQVSYMLPLIFLMAMLKIVFCRSQAWVKMFVQLLLFTPIVFAEAISGYYDLFVAALLVLTIFILFDKSLDIFRKLIVGALFLGTAIASKIFPVVFLPILILPFFDKEARSRWKKAALLKQILVACIAGVLLFGPVGYWFARSYHYTGSPIFPLFQNIFPTPELWGTGSSVNENKMTQTSMNVQRWFSGGFLLYPVLSYFRSDEFVESTRGFPGVVYILLLPIQILCCIVAVRNILLKKGGTRDWMLISLLLGVLGLGFITRYYRYLWPFLFSFAVYSLLYIDQHVKFHAKKWVLYGIFLFLIIVHVVDFVEAMRFAPAPVKNQFFHPDALVTQPPNEIWKQIQTDSSDKPGLDMSLNMLPRVYARGRLFQCNWYWTSGELMVKRTIADGDESMNKLIHRFSYIVAEQDQTKAGRYCDDLVQYHENFDRFDTGSYVLYKVE